MWCVQRCQYLKQFNFCIYMFWSLDMVIQVTPKKKKKTNKFFFFKLQKPLAFKIHWKGKPGKKTWVVKDTSVRPLTFEVRIVHFCIIKQII